MGDLGDPWEPPDGAFELLMASQVAVPDWVADEHLESHVYRPRGSRKFIQQDGAGDHILCHDELAADSLIDLKQKQLYDSRPRMHLDQAPAEGARPQASSSQRAGDSARKDGLVLHDGVPMVNSRLPIAPEAATRN